jgi:hypothetical protein
LEVCGPDHATGGDATVSFVLIFFSSFFYIGLKSAQQLNVIHDQKWLVIPTSFLMAFVEVSIVLSDGVCRGVDCSVCGSREVAVDGYSAGGWGWTWVFIGDVHSSKD